VSKNKQAPTILKAKHGQKKKKKRKACEHWFKCVDFYIWLQALLLSFVFW
jgi:hypothetical protein